MLTPAVLTDLAMAQKTSEDISHRFQTALRLNLDRTAKEEFMHMTLEELGHQQITFGKEKKGLHYSEVVRDDPRYVAWFTSTYKNSDKTPHQKFIRYAALHGGSGTAKQVRFSGDKHCNPGSYVEIQGSTEDCHVSRTQGEDTHVLTMHHATERSMGNAGGNSPSERPDLQHRGRPVPDCAATAVPDGTLECRVDTAVEHPSAASDLQVTPAIDRLQLCEALCRAAASVDHTSIGPDSAHSWEIILNQEEPPNSILLEMHQYWKQKYGVAELREQRKHLLRPGIDLLEVYCSSESALTQAADQSGLVASRFGLRQGDLSTFAGRCALYDQLWKKRPKHIWVSPKRGPWCSWSRLNLMKSQI